MNKEVKPNKDDKTSRAPSRLSTDSREPFAYTPSWLTPEERSRLKARVKKIKKKEEMWGTKKEEDTLVRAGSPSRQSMDASEPTLESATVTITQTKEPVRRRSSAPAGGVIVLGEGPKEEEEKSRTESQESGKGGKNSEKMKKNKSSESVKAKNKKNADGVSRKKSSDSVSKKKSTDSLSKKKSKEELKMAKKSKHPKAVHANPSGNMVEDQPAWIPHPRDSLEAHLWATDFTHFDPQLYQFKTPEKLSTKKPVVAECPPFWVLNDHTIAVAWKLYCPSADRRDLGIVALQWSREFVSAMKDERGEYPFAIKHLLDAIEDALIDRYSKAEEDSKNTHQKAQEDDMSYASSDTVFKPPTEVSYTLRDIMSRNFPGRKSAEVKEETVRKNEHAPVVHKSIVPLPHDVPSMTREDLIAYLKRMKEEQEARVKEEAKTKRDIERLLQQVQDGKFDPKSLSGDRKRHDHVGFQEGGDDDPNFQSPHKKSKKGKDVKKTTSTTSSKSARSATSGKSAKSGDSRGSVSSDASEYSTISTATRPSVTSMSPSEFDADEGKAMQKKGKDKKRSKSKESVASKKESTTTLKASQESAPNKKQSKESVASKKQSKESIGSKGGGKKGSKDGSKKGSKGSDGGSRKGSKGSKKGSK